MSKNVIINKLRTLKSYFEDGKIPVLHKHEVHPKLPIGSRERYLYFIMTCSLNFQRSSPKTWESSIQTWKDKDTNFVFFPEEVVKKSEEVLRNALLKHKLALQPNKHIQIRKTISQTFHNYFDSDPRILFSKYDFDVKKILELIQKEMKSQFPYLSGPKLSNYFLFILINYTDLELKNTDHISIIPDTHIMQATEKLGMLSSKDINPLLVEKTWKELLKESEFSPIDFHSILWNWSRNKFKPEL